MGPETFCALSGLQSLKISFAYCMELEDTSGLAAGLPLLKELGTLKMDFTACFNADLRPLFVVREVTSLHEFRSTFTTVADFVGNYDFTRGGRRDASADRTQ